jgi:two-component system, OmpR family, response regulator
MTKILIVEDEPAMVSGLRDNFEFEGYEVITAGDGVEGLGRALSDSPDLVVLDVMMPRMSGLDVCKQLKVKKPALPIIMLTARGQEVDKVVGLELGADDYVTKPFNHLELLARIKAVLRRASSLATGADTEPSVMRFAGWHLDAVARDLHNPDGSRVILTSAEFDLLVAFCRHPRRTLTRDQLLDLSQGRAGAPLDRSIDILVSRIRRKIESNPRDPEFIKTVRSGGYVFTPEVATQ